MKTKTAVINLSIALSLMVAPMANAAMFAKAIERNFKGYEEFKVKNSGELAAVYAKKAIMANLKGEFATRINKNIDEVRNLNSSRTTTNGLQSFATLKMVDHSNKGAEVHTGVDALEALNIISKEIQNLKTKAVDKADTDEMASLQKSFNEISEFASTIGDLGGVLADVNGTSLPLAIEATQTLIKILPDVLVKFEGSRREAYTQLISKVNELMRSGKMAPADALRKVLDDDAKLEQLRGCKL